MIQFFNINTGASEYEFYNGDYPFVHWAEPFSVGVIRYKAIYFISDEPVIRVRMDCSELPTNWNFAIYNKGPHDELINGFSDINDAATAGPITLSGYDITISGREYKAYQLIIICRADVEGEYIDTFYINGVPYKIGAEFWGENESLKINLANQGTEIPDAVGKAIYTSDIYDENPDWILLNRKFRELLVAHMDIMDNKGSYKSLINALKWFEYGDLVELREVWKYDTPDGAKYYEHAINEFVDDEVRQRMFNSAKTTYFTLRHLKRHIVGHEVADAPVERCKVMVVPGQNSYSNDGPFDVDKGGSVSATFYANDGYMFDGNKSVITKSLINIQGPATIYGPDAGVMTCTVTIIPGANSTANKVTQQVNYGSSISVDFMANEGYNFSDGGTKQTKTVSNIKSDITITGPDARAINPLEEIMEDVPTTPYIRWYPVHGDAANLGGEIYDCAPTERKPYYLVGDALPDKCISTRANAVLLARPIYITAEKLEDKLEIWEAVKNKSTDLKWYYSGPSTNMHWRGYYDEYDPTIAKRDEYAPNTYMRAFFGAVHFGGPSQVEDVIPGTYKIWAEWKGIKSNEILYIVETAGSYPDFPALYPELVDYIDKHPVTQPNTIE